MINRKEHETRIPDNILLENLRKKISSSFRILGLGGIVDFLKNKGLHKVIDKRNTKDVNIAFPPMYDNTREYLLNYFKIENNKLADLINRDLSSWNK